MGLTYKSDQTHSTPAGGGMQRLNAEQSAIVRQFLSAYSKDEQRIFRDNPGLSIEERTAICERLLRAKYPALADVIFSLCTNR